MNYEQARGLKLAAKRAEDNERMIGKLIARVEALENTVAECLPDITPTAPRKRPASARKAAKRGEQLTIPGTEDAQ